MLPLLTDYYYVPVKTDIVIQGHLVYFCNLLYPLLRVHFNLVRRVSFRGSMQRVARTGGALSLWRFKATCLLGQWKQ